MNKSCLGYHCIYINVLYFMPYFWIYTEHNWRRIPEQILLPMSNLYRVIQNLMSSDNILNQENILTLFGLQSQWQLTCKRWNFVYRYDRTEVVTLLDHSLFQIICAFVIIDLDMNCNHWNKLLSVNTMILCSTIFENYEIVMINIQEMFNYPMEPVTLLYLVTDVI